MTKKQKDSSLDYLREGFAKLPDKTKTDETVFELKEGELDSTNPLIKIIRGYQRLAEKEVK